MSVNHVFSFPLFSFHIKKNVSICTFSVIVISLERSKKFIFQIMIIDDSLIIYIEWYNECKR